MANVVNFKQLTELNQLLKEKGFSCSLHGVGGCTCSGLEIRGLDNNEKIDDVVSLINTYLKQDWLKVFQRQDNPMMLKIQSTFDK